MVRNFDETNSGSAPLATSMTCDRTGKNRRSRVPFSERPYGSLIDCTLNESAHFDDVKKIIFKHKEHSRTMPGYYFTLMLEDVTNQYCHCRDWTDKSFTWSSATDNSLQLQNQGSSNKKKRKLDQTELIQSDLQEGRRFLCFSLWNNQEAEATNLFHEKTLERTEGLLPHITSFPKYQFWVQVQGKQLLEKYPDSRTDEQDLTSLGQNPSSLSPDLAPVQSFTWDSSDIVSITYWHVARKQDMDSCFSLLRRVRNYAMTKFSSTTCKQYDVYLTYNLDNPNVFMEFAIWTSYESFLKFLHHPTIRCAHAAIKSKFCRSNDKTANPDISLWQNVI